MRIYASTACAFSCCTWDSVSRLEEATTSSGREGVRERVNIQSDGSHAKPYQVRQVRQTILRYGL